MSMAERLQRSFDACACLVTNIGSTRRCVPQLPWCVDPCTCMHGAPFECAFPGAPWRSVRHGRMASSLGCRYTGFHYVDWVFDGADILYSVRAGYRGANSYHNANRLVVKRVEGFAAQCAPDNQWSRKFTAVGSGWCRPTVGCDDDLTAWLFACLVAVVACIVVG
jgi:hypothetical protein